MPIKRSELAGWVRDLADDIERGCNQADCPRSDPAARYNREGDESDRCQCGEPEIKHRLMELRDKIVLNVLLESKPQREA